MEKYILLYGDKKPEDNISITNMFKNTKQINLGWTDFDYNHNMRIINEAIKKGVKQIVFSGLEIGWDKLIEEIKQNQEEIKIKVICTTSDSLLYYEYERNNFFRLLELSKEKKVNDIAFFRKGQYEAYKNLGYKCSFLMENYCLQEENRLEVKIEKKEELNIGIYPLNYTWDKNIFNQLCIGKMIENSKICYNPLNPRMKEFLDTMKIENEENKISKIEEKEIIKKIIKNDINVSCSFTEYMHPIFFISMELGIPCIIGNNSDLFEKDEELKLYIVTESEDNPIINADIIKNVLIKKEEVMRQYQIWKKKYNQKAKENIEEFLGK